MPFGGLKRHPETAFCKTAVLPTICNAKMQNFKFWSTHGAQDLVSSRFDRLREGLLVGARFDPQ